MTQETVHLDFKQELLMRVENSVNYRVISPKKTGYGRILRRENGIVYIYVDDDVSIDMPEAIQILEDIRALDSSGMAQLLIVQGSNNDMSFAAQKHLGKANVVNYLALVVQSRLQAEVAQFFIKLLKSFRSTYELRVFHLLSDAELWLLNCSDA